jgi:hypothetical protein
MILLMLRWKHKKIFLTFAIQFQDRPYRLTDVSGRVIEEIIA